MSSQYTDSILLEANRLKSVEYTSGNISNTKSNFTNKFAPVQVNAGDSVNLFSGYVSAVGAGGEVIEVKATPLNETVILQESVAELVGVINPAEVNYDASYLPYNASQVNFKLTNVEIDLKANEIPLEFKFYKNTNGELHIHLPRAFDKEQAEEEVGASYNLNWTHNDGGPMGACLPPVVYKRCDNDWMSLKYQADGEAKEIFKRSSKNERYTIMSSKSTLYSDKSASFTSKDWVNKGTTGSSDPQYFHHILDPALSMSLDYEYYQKVIKLTVKEGFDSPSNIAESLTTQLKKSGNPEAIVGQVGVDPAEYKKYDVSTKIESDLYRTFRSATPISFSKANHTAYSTGSEEDGWTAGYRPGAVAYLSNYQFIGMKRPELYFAGRDMTFGEKLLIWEPITKASGVTLIETDVRYTEYECLNFLNWFSSQALYPELFDYKSNDKVNINSARYIHFNASNNASKILGNDNYTGTVDKSSFPLWIDFDPETEFTYNAPSNLYRTSYGCCVPYLTGSNEWFIGFETKELGGIPDYAFNASGVIILDTLIGYDNHFNAYGTDNILLYNGYLNRSFDQNYSFTLDDWGQNARYLNQYATETYIGARDPLINFSSTSSRYEISRLHTSEQVGNYYLSGSGQLPVSADGSAEVYKMNKRLNTFSYTPDMVPYGSGNAEGGVQFFESNENLDRTRIYDSQSGVYINKIGISEANWKKSLMGFLGFTYDQFYNQPNSVKYFIANKEHRNVSSNLLRLDNLNLGGLTTPTTNNSVTSLDSINFCVNVFNTTIYSPQLPLPQTYVKHSGAGVDPAMFPTIVQTSDSTVIKAVNLPLKQEFPYYLIRTSILGKATLDSDRNLYPVIATIDKSTPSNDYFNNITSTTFTFTQPFTITEIFTEITTPNGDYAFCDDRSSVIYRIQKQITQDFNIGQEILQQEQQKK
jgi:hypothetical protein